MAPTIRPFIVAGRRYQGTALLGNKNITRQLSIDWLAPDATRRQATPIAGDWLARCPITVARTCRMGVTASPVVFIRLLGRIQRVGVKTFQNLEISSWCMCTISSVKNCWTVVLTPLQVINTLVYYVLSLKVWMELAVTTHLHRSPQLSLICLKRRTVD